MSKINEVEAFVIGTLEGLERYQPLLRSDDITDTLQTQAHRDGYGHALRDVHRFIQHAKTDQAPIHLVNGKQV